MSGGYNGGTRKGKHDIAPAIRASFLAAIKIVEQKQGKTLPELMAEWLIKDPIAMLNVISKFLPREARVHVEQTPSDGLPETQALLERIRRDRKEQDAALVKNRPEATL